MHCCISIIMFMGALETPGLSSEGLGWDYGKFQAQVSVWTKKGKKIYLSEIFLMFMQLYIRYS